MDGSADIGDLCESFSQRTTDFIGTSQAAVSNMENGRGNPQAETLTAAAAALDVEIIFVPRKMAHTVRNLINDSEFERGRAPSDPGSIFDDLFVPDETDEDDEPTNAGPRPWK